jgi:hypothetical protein
VLATFAGFLAPAAVLNIDLRFGAMVLKAFLFNDVFGVGEVDDLKATSRSGKPRPLKEGLARVMADGFMIEV